jgi:hypothetical protein
MNIIFLFQFAICIWLIHIIAKRIGAKRIIGYRSTVIFSLLFSTIGGFLIAICSPKKELVETDEADAEEAEADEQAEIS